MTEKQELELRFLLDLRKKQARRCEVVERKGKMGKKTLLMMLPTALEASEMRAMAILSLLRRKIVMRRTMAQRLTLMIKRASHVSLNWR